MCPPDIKETFFPVYVICLFVKGTAGDGRLRDRINISAHEIQTDTVNVSTLRRISSFRLSNFCGKHETAHLGLGEFASSTKKDIDSHFGEP